LGYSLQGQPCGHDGRCLTDCAYYALDVLGQRGTVEGLEPDRCYRFWVCARNSAGFGAASELSPVVRTSPAPPLAPPAPSAVSASSQTIQVTWGEAMLSASARPLQWEIAVLLADAGDGLPGPCTRVVRARAPPVAIKCLELFTSYCFRVRVRGEGGWSAWSEASEPIETSDEWTDEEIVDHLMPRFGGSLANVFRGFDRDCDGFISEADLLRGLDEAGLAHLAEERKLQLFLELDEGGRGLVTLREFSKCLSRAAATAPSRGASPRGLRGDTSPSRGMATQRRTPGRRASPSPPALMRGAYRQSPGSAVQPYRPRSLSPPIPTRTMRRLPEMA